MQRMLVERMQRKIIMGTNIVLLIIFIICQWMMDISSWIHKDKCATNGFVINCSNTLTYHITWYISIIIVVIFVMQLIIKD